MQKHNETLCFCIMFDLTFSGFILMQKHNENLHFCIMFESYILMILSDAET